jgi:hypothetical protein
MRQIRNAGLARVRLAVSVPTRNKKAKQRPITLVFGGIARRLKAIIMMVPSRSHTHHSQISSAVRQLDDHFTATNGDDNIAF